MVKSNFPYQRKDQVRDQYPYWGNYNRNNSPNNLNNNNFGGNNNFNNQNVNNNINN